MQEHKYSIKQWAKDDQPREKLLSNGAENLSNSELLAILIRSGSKEKSAIELAKSILKLGKDNLSELGKHSTTELMKIKGVGKVKAITILAALELGRRRQATESFEKPIIGSSYDVANFLRTKLKDYRHEVFAVIFLNKSNKVRHFEIISKGGMTGTVADPRIIIRKALEQDAVNIILCHNHPSGNLRPSSADKQLTMNIKEAANFFDISILDHIIVSEEGYYSFADEEIL